MYVVCFDLGVGTVDAPVAYIAAGPPTAHVQHGRWMENQTTLRDNWSTIAKNITVSLDSVVKLRAKFQSSENVQRFEMNAPRT